jgi:hypothetical protein
VPVDGTGTASVAPVMAPPVPGVQKPPRRVRKRFWDRLVVALVEKVKKLAGVKTRPARLQQDRLGAKPAVCRRDGLPGVVSAAVQDLRRLTAITSPRDPPRMVKEQGPRRRMA